MRIPRSGGSLRNICISREIMEFRSAMEECEQNLVRDGSFPIVAVDLTP